LQNGGNRVLSQEVEGKELDLEKGKVEEKIEKKEKEEEEEDGILELSCIL